MVVGIKEAPPFVIRGEDGAWSGVSIDLWEQIAERREFEFQYREFDLQELLTAVESPSVDIAVGALSMTPARERRFDFSHPYFVTGLGIAIHRDHRSSWSGSLSRFVSWRFLQVVGVLSLLLFACGALVWLFERKRNDAMFGGRAHEGIGAGFWWAAVTMTTVGYGDKTPKTVAGRLVALLWMFASLLVVSAFTAAIASALTVGALESPIDSPEDLVGSRVATVADSSSEVWLQGQGVDYTSYPEISQALTALAQKQADAVVYDLSILSYLIHDDSSLPLVVLPHSFELQPYAFALPTDSPLLEPLNRDLLDITSDKEWYGRVLELVGLEY